MAFDPLTHLALKYRGRSIAVFREHCLRHEGLLAVAQRAFPSLQDDVSAGDVVFMAPIPGSPDTEPVELLPEIWTTVCHVVHTVTITLKSEMQSIDGSTTACGSPVSSELQVPGTSTPSLLSPLLRRLFRRPAPQPPQQERLSIGLPPTAPEPQVQSHTKQSSDVIQAINITFPVYLKPAQSFISELGLLEKKVSRLYELIDPELGYSASNSTLIFGSSYLNEELTFSDYGIVSGDTIVLSPKPVPTMRPTRVRRAPRKPVIYLYPPSSLADVTVELALASSWRFSAVHPPPRTTVPPGEPHTAQSLTWTVAAEPNGTLVDKTSGIEVSYLYWEAITISHPVTPGTSRATTPTETFDPARPSLNPGDSVLLPTSKVPRYLDVALKALALHTEARTSFITLRIPFFPTLPPGDNAANGTDGNLPDRFWLPDMLKHEFIALRFVAQDAYERAAPMRVVPAPDVVTRVFMLFRGVSAGDLGLWEAASARAASAEGAFWTDVVGVDAARAADSGLFRVLEWGGMEV